MPLIGNYPIKMFSVLLAVADNESMYVSNDSSHKITATGDPKSFGLCYTRK